MPKRLKRKSVAQKQAPPEPRAPVVVEPGRLGVNLFAFPVAPLVGFSDGVSVEESDTHLAVTFFERATGSVVQRIILDPVSLAVAIIPLIGQFHADTLRWLESSGLEPIAPAVRPPTAQTGVAPRAMFVRLSRFATVADLEWYGVPSYALHIPPESRAKRLEAAPVPIARVQVPVQLLSGLLGRLIQVADRASVQYAKVLARLNKHDA